MRFESKFGLGEIVCTKQIETRGTVRQDQMFEVVAVIFSRGSTPGYVCRHGQTGGTSCFEEGELIGDPDFDQETGRYAETP